MLKLYIVMFWLVFAMRYNHIVWKWLLHFSFFSFLFFFYLWILYHWLLSYCGRPALMSICFFGSLPTLSSTVRQYCILCFWQINTLSLSLSRKDVGKNSHSTDKITWVECKNCSRWHRCRCVGYQCGEFICELCWQFFINICCFTCLTASLFWSYYEKYLYFWAYWSKDDFHF